MKICIIRWNCVWRLKRKFISKILECLFIPIIPTAYDMLDEFLKDFLSTAFFKNLEKSLQKLLASVRDQSAGILQESGSHPISVNLYKLILEWSISKSDVFVWFWTLCQWNNMAQCSNIDPLGSHNYSLGMDFIICKYDDSKMYKMGTICQKIYLPILTTGRSVGGKIYKMPWCFE